MHGMSQSSNGLSSQKFLLRKNVLGQTQFKAILDSISSSQFPWFFQRDTTYGSGFSTDSSYHGFRHCLIKNGQKNSDFTELLVPLAWYVCDQINRELVDIYSMHVNLIENYNKSTPPRPHTDRELSDPNIENMYTAVYYLDEVDGTTVFYDEDKETIIYEQTPIQNAMLIFPAATWHGANNPIVAPYRRVVNINVEVK
jgi:hypothetical protein